MQAELHIRKRPFLSRRHLGCTSFQLNTDCAALLRWKSPRGVFQKGVFQSLRACSSASGRNPASCSAGFCHQMAKRRWGIVGSTCRRMPQPREGALGWPWGQTELWCQICSARVQFVGVGMGRSAWWEISHPSVRLSGSHGSGKDLGQELVRVLGWKPGLSEGPQGGFQGCFSPAVPRAMSQSVCGPTRATWELVGCEHDTLLLALKPHSSEEVVTSPQKNNPEEPI